MSCFNLCDVCSDPGHCCFGIYLNYADDSPTVTGETSLEALIQLASLEMQDCEGTPTVGSPFYPLFRNDQGNWQLWCVNLTRDGRCGDYANRPMLCKDYKPAQDRLCAMYTSPPDGVETKDAIEIT